jgi:5-carboxymethyl-2-hydroxymuconate isomerase
MKLMTFSIGERVRIGEVVGDTVYALAWADTMRQMVRRGLIASRAYERFPVDQVTVHAPLMPGKIVAIGLNYADHARETGREAPPRPLIFAKYPSAVIGKGTPITWKTAITNQVDYEGELGVIIGRRAKDVPEADALNYVFGYTIANDVSARDLQHGTDSQWTRGKSLDTFCPLGPMLVTRDEVENPQALGITTRVNGEVMQQGTTADMIFSVAHLIAYCSANFTLEPGDLILTGTPAGVGAARDPQRFLNDGDTVSITIDGLGELVNPCRRIDG